MELIIMQVWNRILIWGSGRKLGFEFLVRSKIGWGISQILVINRVRVLGRGPHTPTQFFRENPSSLPLRAGNAQNLSENINTWRQKNSSQLLFNIMVQIYFDSHSVSFAFCFSERIIIYLKNRFAQAIVEPQACVYNCRVISPEYCTACFSL